MERNLRELNDIDKDSIEQRLLLAPTVDRIQDSLRNRNERKYNFEVATKKVKRKMHKKLSLDITEGVFTSIPRLTRPEQINEDNHVYIE